MRWKTLRRKLAELLELWAWPFNIYLLTIWMFSFVMSCNLIESILNVLIDRFVTATGWLRSSLDNKVLELLTELISTSVVNIRLRKNPVDRTSLSLKQLQRTETPVKGVLSTQIASHCPYLIIHP